MVVSPRASSRREVERRRDQACPFSLFGERSSLCFVTGSVSSSSLSSSRVKPKRPSERRPAARRATFSPVLAEEFLPVYDVSDEVATIVDADPQTVWEALMNTDLLEVGKRVPLAGVLGALRMLPEIVSHLLHGERPPQAPESLRLRELAQMQPEQGGWILLGERPGEELALGLVGKFWRPVIQYAQVSADGFSDFDEPGYAKTIYDLSVRPLPDGRSMLSGLMRTATTDEHARRWFRRYWTFGVGSGAHVLVHALLETVRDTAERVHTDIGSRSSE
jgi:hypothetical protein